MGGIDITSTSYNDVIVFIKPGHEGNHKHAIISMIYSYKDGILQYTDRDHTQWTYFKRY